MDAVRLELFVTSVDVRDYECKGGLAGIAYVRSLPPVFRMDVLNQLKIVGRYTVRLSWDYELSNLWVGVPVDPQGRMVR